MSHPIFTVLAKEVIDNLRDRRSWMISLVTAALGPLMLIAIIAMTRSYCRWMGPRARRR